MTRKPRNESENPWCQEEPTVLSLRLLSYKDFSSMTTKGLECQAHSGKIKVPKNLLSKLTFTKEWADFTKNFATRTFITCQFLPDLVWTTSMPHSQQLVPNEVETLKTSQRSRLQGRWVKCLMGTKRRVPLEKSPQSSIQKKSPLKDKGGLFQSSSGTNRDPFCPVIVI